MSMDANTIKKIQNPHILGAFAKAIGYLDTDKNISVSISGGSDSDVVMDFITRCGIKDKVKFVFFDTGLEYQATKDHLDYLENRYGVEINRIKSYMSVPVTCKRYGIPFISKFISDKIERLQTHGFKFEDKPYEELLKEYPNCKSAIRWWCNDFDMRSWCISYKKLLKEFMIENPPDFRISAKCCYYAKKKTAETFHIKNNTEMDITGLRKAEGGVRSTAYKSCYSSKNRGPDNYRPIWWFSDKDKSDYCKLYDIKNSRAYTEYGFRRTGCTCCPFGLNMEFELKQTERYEPKLFRAVNSVFGKSYEYTRKYYEFRRERENEMIRSNLKTKSILEYEKVIE